MVLFLHGKNLERKSTKVQRSFLNCGFPEVLTISLIHIQTPAIGQNYDWLVSVPTFVWLQQLLLQLNRYQLLYLSEHPIPPYFSSLP